jgi:NAD(P)-dependent dehydrogenase (short-subunit alcohol dehydrogenase family)
VTGVARGIDRAIAQRLLSEGATVYLGDIDPFTLSAEEIADFGDHAIPTKLNTTDRRRAHGRLDGLVNNAANIDASPFETLHDTFRACCRPIWAARFCPRSVPRRRYVTGQILVVVGGVTATF